MNLPLNSNSSICLSQTIGAKACGLFMSREIFNVFPFVEHTQPQAGSCRFAISVCVGYDCRQLNMKGFREKWRDSFEKSKTAFQIYGR